MTQTGFFCSGDIQVWSLFLIIIQPKEYEIKLEKYIQNSMKICKIPKNKSNKTWAKLLH